MWERSNCNFTKGLFPTNTTIRGYTNSVELIDFNHIDKGCQDKEKLNNNRGILLTSNIAKLFEKIIINRLNDHLQFTEA